MFLFSLQLEIKNKHVPRDSVNHKGHRTMPTPEQPYTPDLSLSLPGYRIREANIVPTASETT
jgi:hypothetical protein